MRIIYLALKDLYQIVRDWKAALFLLIMPIAFTVLLGFTFGGMGGSEEDPRLPVAVLDRDESQLSAGLISLLETSPVLRRVDVDEADRAALAQQVADQEIVAAVIIPAGYGAGMRAGEASLKLEVVLDEASSAGITARGEIQRLSTRLDSAARAARLSVEALAMADQEQYDTPAAQDAAFDAALSDALAAWSDPPITMAKSASGQDQAESEEEQTSPNAFAHTSAGIMVQFAIAGLIGASEVIVMERKSRTLQRMLTTTLSRAGLVGGHFLAMFVMVLAQLSMLILFGQLVLDVGYFRAPLATALMVLTTTFFVAALGMLIGAISQTAEHTVIYSMILMMVLSGMGGAWMPLEETSETFQTIGHLLPTAWAIDGLKNITMRGLGLNSVLLPAGILVGFGVACLALAVWQFRVE